MYTGVRVGDGAGSLAKMMARRRRAARYFEEGTG